MRVIDEVKLSAHSERCMMIRKRFLVRVVGIVFPSTQRTVSCVDFLVYRKSARKKMVIKKSFSAVLRSACF